jgi:glycosyltransferase involved in cell wall biosynthesis
MNLQHRLRTAHRVVRCIGSSWWARAGRGAGDGSSAERRVIGIDFTPFLPAGENGGIKPWAMELTAALARAAPHRGFVILTSAACHDEFASLDSVNVRRVCVGTAPTAFTEELGDHTIGLLFCPVVAPRAIDPRVRFVSLAPDLQHGAHPEFFDPTERRLRQQGFERAVRHADRIVTYSRFVREQVLRHSDYPADRVAVIRHGRTSRFPSQSATEVDSVLERHGLRAGEYLFYPANFWPHKNHRLLLESFASLRRRRPDLLLKLVFSGSWMPDPGAVLRSVLAMDVADAVVYAGYASEAEYVALLRGCKALVYPSLYEGFGLPVLEAMSEGRPVLCSNVTSMPEVAGDAAITVDPRDPDQIAAAIERVCDDSLFTSQLVKRGLRHAQRFGDTESVARAYLSVFDEVLSEPARYRDCLSGVHADGWTSRRFCIAFRASEVPRTLLLALKAPRPGSEPVRLSARSASGQVYGAIVPANQEHQLRWRLPREAGYLAFELGTTFVPARHGISTDGRTLGVQVLSCRIASSGPAQELARGSDDGLAATAIAGPAFVPGSDRW